MGNLAAEQQPDVSGLVGALECAKNLIANHSGGVLPDEYAGDQIEQIDTALAAYRKQGAGHESKQERNATGAVI